MFLGLRLAAVLLEPLGSFFKEGGVATWILLVLLPDSRPPFFAVDIRAALKRGRRDDRPGAPPQKILESRANPK